MSRYTMQIRYICEHFYDNNPYSVKGISTVLQSAWSKIFDFDFPFYGDQDAKKEWCIKLLRHYYTYEIGFETYALFKLELENKLNLIMPYYNELYKSTEFELNPLNNYKITTKRKNIVETGENTQQNGGKDSTNLQTNNTTEKTVTKNENKNTGSETNTGSTSNKTYNQDTPQGYVGDLSTSNYLSDVSQSSGSANSTGKSDSTDNFSGDSSTTNTGTINYKLNETNNNTTVSNKTGIENYEETVEGKNSGTSYAQAIMEYREAILNIDRMIYSELNELFMGVM